MNSPFRNVKAWLIFALILFWGIGFGYSMVVPPFESPDELYHYGFVRHLAQGNWLPVQSAEDTGPWSHEGSQAPLYYLTAGLLTRTVDQSDFEQRHPTNRQANLGNPLFPGNKNRMLYSARRTCFTNCETTLDLPLTGTNLAMHLSRWLSLLLGGLSLCLLYLTGRLAFPQQPAVQVLALLIMATIPQFAFISASVNNDNAITLMGAAIIYWLARLLAKTDDKSITTIEWIILGVLLGLAALSKLQGLGLWLMAALAGLALMWKRRDWMLPLRAILPVALPAILICGWWYWRNYTLYDDWIGATHLLDINGRRQNSPDWIGIIDELRGLRYSFWGIFGWFNILLPNAIYHILDWATIAAAVGLVISFIRGFHTHPSLQPPLSLPHIGGGTVERDEPSTIHLLLFVWATLSIALILYWIRNATASQGRLLFPALTAFALLLSAGWYGAITLFNRWLPQRAIHAVLLALPALLLGCSIYALTWLLPNAYAAPKPLAQIPASAMPVNVRYADTAEAPEALTLLAVDVAQGRFYPGDRVPVTLYHTTDAPLANDYQLFIQLLDENGSEIANLTGNPGWGRNPTTLWQPGAIYPDRYAVEITQPIDSASPLLARVYTGFVQPSTIKGDRLPVDAFTESGEPFLPIVGTVAVSPAINPSSGSGGESGSEPLEDSLNLIPVGSEFGGTIRLAGYTPVDANSADSPNPDILTITLAWEALAPPATDYIAFLHLRTVTSQDEVSQGAANQGAAGHGAADQEQPAERIAGFDQPPAANRFPTSHWLPGDQIISQFPLTLPPELSPELSPDLLQDSYELWVGLYETESQGATLLPVTNPGNGFTEHNQVRIGIIELGR